MNLKTVKISGSFTVLISLAIVMVGFLSSCSQKAVSPLEQRLNEMFPTLVGDTLTFKCALNSEYEDSYRSRNIQREKAKTIGLEELAPFNPYGKKVISNKLTVFFTELPSGYSGTFIVAMLFDREKGQLFGEHEEICGSGILDMDDSGNGGVEVGIGKWISNGNEGCEIWSSTGYAKRMDTTCTFYEFFHNKSLLMDSVFQVVSDTLPGVYEESAEMEMKRLCP